MYLKVTETSFETKETTTIWINYKSLKYTHITQKKKMSMYDLISNVGGTLGLFAGVSFVSLFEITEILLEIGFIILARLTSRSVKQQLTDTTLQRMSVSVSDQNEELKSRILDCERKIRELMEQKVDYSENQILTESKT